MTGLTRFCRSRFGQKDTPDEIAQYARLAKAERDVADLQARATRAVNFLDERSTRNHWREALEQALRGA